MKRFSENLLSTAIWIAALPVFGAVCVLIWLASWLLPSRILEPLIKHACRFVLFVCGIRISVSGRDNVVPGGRYIVMMNHVNFFDPLVLYAAFPGWARGVEEESHFRWPLYGATIRRLGVIPISRTDSSRAIESMKRAAAMIRARPDLSFAVLPEGTRTPDGRLGAFKRGGFLLALETGLPVLPIVQIGARDINRKGSLLIRPGRIRLLIEPPVKPDGVHKEHIWEFVDRVRGFFVRRLEGARTG